jgi:ABC-type sugar transport system ATPase subunit
MEELGIDFRDKDKPVRNFDAYVYNSILLTRWLLFKPEILVCIEPFGKADVIMKDIIYKVLSEIAQTGPVYLFLLLI